MFICWSGVGGCRRDRMFLRKSWDGERELFGGGGGGGGQRHMCFLGFFPGGGGGGGGGV